MSLLSAAVLLFLVLDPLGNVPFFAGVLQRVPPARRLRVVVRELLVALAVLVGFLFVGKHLLALLHVSQSSLGMAGGIILFLIAVKMIFAGSGEVFHEETDGEPFIVPLAVPLIAGPSALTTVILLTAREPARRWEWLAALCGAWLVSGLILLSAERLVRLLGNKVLLAAERLMGMLLTAVAVEMFVAGVRSSFLS